MKKPKNPVSQGNVARLGASHQHILDFIEQYADTAFSFKQLARKLQISTRDEKIELAQILQNLARNGGIVLLPDGTFRSVNGQRFVTGTVDFVNVRFAFILSPDTDEDVKVSAENLNDALDGDEVKVRLFTNRRTRRAEGEVIEIISRKRTRFVGRIEVHENFAYVTPDNKRTYFDIFVGKEHTLSAKTGDKVIVEIGEWGHTGRNPVGKVVNLLGAAGHNETEMHAILAEFDLPISFDPEIETAAEVIPAEITQADIAARRDFRNITTFTIDPVDAKDFDDAISVRALPNGNLEIGVHIADVSHYVAPGTLLDKEAASRATSVYLVDRTIPMLPERLSNNLCSLRPNEDKLTFSSVFEISRSAEIVNEWFGRTIIRSDRRFTYDEAQEVIETGTGDYSNELHDLQRLALQFRAHRFNNGSIGFESPEVKFVLDDAGKPLAVIPKERKDAHKLVEEFMLLANVRVAEFVYNLKKDAPRNTMVYRIHEAPNPEKIRVFGAFARKFGYKLNLDEKELPASLNNLITALQGKPEEDVLQHLAIRTMSKARYSIEPNGHFGLAFDHYTHFTSPIRRYPDVICHRLLQHYLDGGKPAEAHKLEMECKHSSDMEKRASDAERASIKYKQVEYMQLQEDKIFEGIVSGVTEWGFYVEIIQTKCEGLVRMTDLQDDYYELDAENYRIVGQKNKRIIAFGDKVEVKVKATNLEKRTIDLKLVDEDLERYVAMKRSDKGRKPGRRG